MKLDVMVPSRIMKNHFKRQLKTISSAYTFPFEDPHEVKERDQRGSLA
jgi:hypothetical protein